MGGSGSSEKAAAASPAAGGGAVKVNVYSPTGGQHAVYHTGVEVLGGEYVFGGGDTSYSGVTVQRPRVPPPGSGWVFYQSVEIGPLRMPRDDALRALTELRGEFPASSYDLVSRNCNHWSEAVCQRLCGQGLPGWINRLAGLGSAVRSAVGGAAGSAGKPAKADGGAGGPAAAGLVARTAAADGDLTGEVDWTSAGVLNAREAEPTSALQGGGLVCSEEGGSPELLLQLPFQAPVKLRSLCLEAPSAAAAPQKARLFANQRDLDMDDAAGGAAATQEFLPLPWAPVGEPGGAVAAKLELNFLKFQGLGYLCLYLGREEVEEGGEAIAVQGLRLLG